MSSTLAHVKQTGQCDGFKDSELGGLGVGGMVQSFSCLKMDG